MICQKVKKIPLNHNFSAFNRSFLSEIIEKVKEEVIKVAPPSKSAPQVETPPPSPSHDEVEEQIIERVVVETHSEPIVTVEKSEVFIHEARKPENHGN